ncbi:hypothetical protein H9P43_008062 [Blastocladiella emersonii ATCC 22665]|nr:hypothetical protein H9P43_008062 [Blastocladiella emersonii ATCC 22665]
MVMAGADDEEEGVEGGLNHTAPAGIFSHKFAPLLLYQAMRWLDLAGVAAGEVTEQDVECIASTINVNGKPMLNVALHDYVFRPPKLENLSWYEFISSWSRVNMPPKMREVLANGGRVVPAQAELGPAADMPPGTRLSFMADHPLAKTHELRKNIVEVVPKIAGPHMPDPRKFGDVPGSKEKYSRMALLLLRHFRVSSDIFDENGLAIAKFKAFKEGLQPGDPALNHLEYAQEYYFSLDGARAYRECRDRENAELSARLSQEERGELFVPTGDSDRNASSSRAKATANEDPTAEWTMFTQSQQDTALDPVIADNAMNGAGAEVAPTVSEQNFKLYRRADLVDHLRLPPVRPFDVKAAVPPTTLKEPISANTLKRFLAQHRSAASAAPQRRICIGKWGVTPLRWITKIFLDHCDLRRS